MVKQKAKGDHGELELGADGDEDGGVKMDDGE